MTQAAALYGFFQRENLTLKILASIYVLGLLLGHSAFATAHVWWLAAFFSIVMNFTYPLAALIGRTFISVEFVISMTLILMSVMGVLGSPLWVIAAIFLHGVWDLFKHNGKGIPFHKWYTMGCVVVDWIYAATLFLFFIQIDGGV